jgi:hypothetical protein
VLSIGYLAEDLEFISGLGKILPIGRGKRDDQSWERFCTPELNRLIRERDWALFEMIMVPETTSLNRRTPRGSVRNSAVHGMPAGRLQRRPEADCLRPTPPRHCRREV